MATIQDLYKQVLGRTADPEGLAYWQGQFGGNTVDQAGEDIFRQSAASELAQTGFKPPTTAGSTPPYDPNGLPNSITNLYQNVLGRNPDEAGLKFWNRQFGGNTADQAQRQQFIGAAGNELSSNASQWTPQTQTYGQPYMPTNAKGGSSVNMNYGPQQAPSSKGVGKGAPGYQGVSTNSATSGQPQIGQPNPYSNTVGMRDNSMNTAGGGKGKGV